MTIEYLTVDSEGALAPADEIDGVGLKLQRLEDNPNLYFDLSQAHTLIPLPQLINTRAREKGIANANKLMQEAAKGTQAKRKPISVRSWDEKLWLVMDGNSTLVNARFSGWQAIPCATE